MKKKLFFVWVLSLTCILSLGPLNLGPLSDGWGERRYRIYAIPPVTASPGPDTVYGDTSDGFVYSSGATYDTGSWFLVGDIPTNVYGRGFVKFSLSGITGTLTSATLYLYLRHSTINDGDDSTSPLTNPGLGNLQVIHVPDYGTLDATDFNTASLGNDPGTLIGSAETPNIGYVSISVKAAMQDDIDNARANTTYRLQLETNTDGDGKKDAWTFTQADFEGTYQDPYIEYTIPAAPEFPAYFQPLLIVIWTVLFASYMLKRRGKFGQKAENRLAIDH